MPVDEHDEHSKASSTEPEGDAPVTLREAPEAEPAPAPLTPKGQRARWRRVVNRRNAMWTGLVAVVALVALALIFFVLYRTGQVDRIIARQIVSTFAEYNIRAEVGSFQTKFGPRTAELRDLKLYDATTGTQLGKIDRMLATIRVEDLWALNLRRNVNLESLVIDGLESWVVFDEQGNSNFRNITIPPPDPNSRILFSYSTATVKLNGALLHFNDVQHELSGEARNLTATVQPDDPSAPAESRMNRVDLALSDSTFVYDGRPVNDISIEAHARVNQVRAEVSELTLRSPVAEAHLVGALDDWRDMRYHLRAEADVDLTQISDVLQGETTLRGAGRFTGTITGEGDKYKVEDGHFTSDALAADNVRLKALNVNATVTGEGKSYEAQGRAIAELLTAGDFQLNSVQLAGGVMGTGTDFRWVGDLRAAAARSGATSITGLIAHDAVAELREGQLTGSAKTFSASGLNASGAQAGGVQASNVRFARGENGATQVSASGASAGTVRASGATIKGVTASGVEAKINPDNSASVSVDQLRVGGLDAEGAHTGSLNIAGVRLAISSGGRVEGTSGDINAGTVALKGGDRAESVRLARPVFTIEPGGRYRASADLSLGGGVLGQMKLGAVRSAVVASNNQIQLNNFVAEVFNGRARGNAVISTSPRGGGASSVAATFEGVDAGGLIATLTGNAVPLTGAATGTVDVRFPGTNFKAASGRLNAQFSGETGREEGGRTPLTGDLALTADRGLFQIERANLRTGATQLNASGKFSFREGSNLTVKLASTDASELQRVLVSSGLIPATEEKLTDYGVQLAGNLDFDGTVTGSLDDPIVNGRVSLASLALRGRELGALSAEIASNNSETRINNGRLAEPDGGGAQFTAVIPRAGENNISFDATLDRANAGNLIAALAGAGGRVSSILNSANLSNLGPMSGHIKVEGFPSTMGGSADVKVAAGRIGTQPYEEIAARATFSGSTINIETIDARLPGGRINASGTVNTESQSFDLRAKGDDVRLDLLTQLFGAGPNLPQLSGLANFNATVAGKLSDPNSYRVELNAQGRDVTVNGRPAGELTLTGRTTADQKFNLELTTGLLGQPGKPQVVRAQIDFGSEDLATTFETTLTGTDLTPLFQALLPDANVRVTGRATGTLKASGNLLGEEGFDIGGLKGRAEFSELTVMIEDVPLTAENPLVVLFSPKDITFEKTRFTGPGTNIVFGGTAALREGGTQSLTVNGDLNLRVLNKISPDVFLSGAARVGVAVTGSFSDPRINGTASVANATFAVLVTDERLTVTNINGLVRFDTNQARIESLNGNLGGGRVEVTGGALLAGLRPSQFRLSVRGNNVTVPFPDKFRTTADAAVEISGTLDSQIIRGTANVRRTEYTEDIDLADLIGQRREATITEGGESNLFGATQLDLTIQGRDALVVRNNLADAVGSVSLRVVGPIDDPVVSGRITATRGTLAFRNDRYDIQRAIIDLPPRRGADPVLNIQAESEIRGYRVEVGITGPLTQPVTSLRSDPALPQSDVVSLITTGNLSSGVQGTSTLAQTGLGTATSLLTDTLINAPVRKATDRLFGLNRFEFDPLITGRSGSSPTARLTVGRQINRDLAVTYSTNITGEPNQVVAVEYRVSDRLSFVAQYQQGSTDTLRTQSNNFNFELRFRKRY
ncbi:MAG: translocation/assembly module TamB [Acidobacteria bacterium]|nr:translocation/assembly module TamB [Acidobacteriota bacterium]